MWTSAFSWTKYEVILSVFGQEEQEIVEEELRS